MGHPWAGGHGAVSTAARFVTSCAAMGRTIKILLVVTAVILALVAVFAGPTLAWRLQRARPLAVVVLDKTVPFRNYREHDTFTWLLHAMKVPRPNGRYLDPARDYVGFDPRSRAGSALGEAQLRDAAMLFVADTYGVYVDDYRVPGDVAHMERSSLIFGGIDEPEARAIEAFAARGGAVVAEFNTFASPTEQPARAVLENLFGVRWTHWVGRYWDNLQDPNEVPRWVGRVYTQIYHRPFDLRGPGFAFFRDDEDMVVLQPGRHLGPAVSTIVRTSEAPELTDLPPGGSYRYWLDIVVPTRCDVVYEHRLDLLPEGARLLAAHGIPAGFPALVRRREGPRAWYFSGDFVDSGATRGDPERAGLLAWRRAMASPESDPAGAFLWQWYAPVMEHIVGEVMAAPRAPR